MTVPPLSGQLSGAARHLPVPGPVAISAIAVPRHACPLNEVTVDQLMLSIQRTGLLNPLLVARVQNSDAYLLVAGLHRLEALRRLGLTQALVIVREGKPEAVEMDQIEENLARKELSMLERAFQEKRLHELYVKHYPETRRGVAGAIARHRGATEITSFAEGMARPGSGAKTISNRIALAKNLRPEAAAVLYGTPVANHLAKLKALSKVPSEEQPKVATVLSSGSVATVDEAARSLRGLPLLVRPPKVSGTTVPLESTEEGQIATASFLGRKVVVTITRNPPSVTLEDTGAADPHRGYSNDGEMLDPSLWARTIEELVAELPTSIAKDIQVDTPQRIEVGTYVQNICSAIRVKKSGRDGVLALRVDWSPASEVPIRTDRHLRDGISYGQLSGHISGKMTVGHFRREFRQFFSQHVLKRTHLTADAFAMRDAPEPKKPAKEDRSTSKPGPRKAAPRGNDLRLKLKSALGKQQFKPQEVSKALEGLRGDIEAGTDFKELLVKAIQFLTPPKTVRA
jgi:ParB family transcriptional regulator, chromosome partitioning protein